MSQLGTTGEWRIQIRKKLFPIETELDFTMVTANSYCRRLLIGDYILSFFSPLFSSILLSWAAVTHFPFDTHENKIMLYCLN
jgi:hypothetical protein